MNATVRTSGIRSVSAWGASLFIVGAWLTLHPYHGIRHDGILYLGQTLALKKPELYAGDVYFAYGSQDQFSIFSNVYSLAIDVFGLSFATHALLMLGQAAFLVTAAALLRRFVSGYGFFLGLAAIAVFPSDYGSGKVAYAEDFLTARVLAEPLCLLALYLVLRRSYVYAAFAGGVALTMHPLIALPALAAAWVCICLRHPRYWLSAGALVIVPVLAYLGIAPFPHLLQRIDMQWLGAIESDSMVFMQQWAWLDWASLGFDLIVMAWASRFFEGDEKRFASAIFIVALGGALITMIGVDGLKNHLFAELQLWRAQWLAHLFALGLTPMLVVRLGEDKNPSRSIAAWLLGTSLIAIGYRGGIMALILALLLAGPAAANGVVLSMWVRRFVQGVCLLIALVVALKSHSGHQFDMTGILSDSVWDIFLRIPTRPVFWMALAIAAIGLTRQFPSSWPTFMLGIVAVATGIDGWDQRNGWARFLENGFGYDHPFKKYIQPSQQVYWYGDITGALAVWILLERPNYFSDIQGAGLIFSREKTVEYRKRGNAFEALFFQEGVCSVLNTLNNANRECAPSVETLHEVCSVSPGLAFIILAAKVDAYAEAEWDFEDTAAAMVRRNYLYRCESLRKIK